MFKGHDHHKGRVKKKVSDAMIALASIKLSERQFIAWKFATLDGLSDVQISDRMFEADPDALLFPSEIDTLLVGCARRGFPVDGTVIPKVKETASA